MRTHDVYTAHAHVVQFWNASARRPSGFPWKAANNMVYTYVRCTRKARGESHSARFRSRAIPLKIEVYEHTRRTIGNAATVVFLLPDEPTIQGDFFVAHPFLTAIVITYNIIFDIALLWTIIYVVFKCPLPIIGCTRLGQGNNSFFVRYMFLWTFTEYTETLRILFIERKLNFSVES